MTGHYNEGEKLDVEFDTAAYASPDGTVTVAPNVREAIGKNLEGPQELKVICDTLCHEVEHVRRSDLKSKRRFMQMYPDWFAQTAGLVINILEDQYVDASRLSRFKGLKPVHDFTNKAIISNHRRHPKIGRLDRTEQFIAGMMQIHIAGYAKGYEDAEEDVQEYLAWYRKHLGAVRRTHDPKVREAIAARVADRLLELFPEPEEIDKDELEEMIEEHAENGQLELTHEDGPFPVSPLELTDEAKEALEEMIENGDLPQAPSGGEGEEGEEAEGGAGGDAADGVDDEAASITDGDSGDREGSGEDGEGEAGSAGHESSDAPGEDATKASEGSTSQGTITEGDEIAHEVETLKGGESTAAWFDDTADDEVDASTWGRRYDRLVEEIQKDQTDTAEMRRDRDEIIDEGRIGRYNETGEDVRDHLRDTGLAEEVVEAFRKIKTAPEPTPTEAGDRLHLRNYVRFAAGDTSERNLYQTTEISELGGRGIGVTLDMSGSMDTSELQAKSAVGALALAANEVDDEFVANAFFTPTGCKVETTAITTPGEEFEWDHLDAVWPQANDPITYGMQNCVSMLEDLEVSERVMFVVTDGRPTLTSGGGINPDRKSSRDAVNEAAEYVRKVRAEHGITVIGLGVGYGVNPELLGKMFGENGYVHCEEDEMADALLEAYTTQLDVSPDL